MKNFTKLTLILTMLFGIVGGVSSVKAEKVKLSSSAITKVNADCDYDKDNYLFTWNGTSNNTARILQFDAGLLAYFTKLHITCDVKTEGGNFRVLIGNGSSWKQFYYAAGTTEIDIPFSSGLSEEELLGSTEIRIAGNSVVSSAQTEAGIDKHKMKILPSDIYLESNRDLPFAIASASDWNEFSLFVKNGLSRLDAILTADIEVTDGSMIGVGSNNSGADNPNAYSGTFDGQNYTITYSSPKTTEKVTAPFRFVKNGTIQNLKTAGSMSSMQNIMGGIAGFVQGTVVINNCYSSMNLSTDDTTNDATIGGILALQDQSTTLRVTNCMYTGTLTGDHGVSGIAGYMRNGEDATFRSVLYAGSYVTENASPANMENIVRGGGTLTDCYYVSKIAGNTSGTEATIAKLESGEVACYLQGEQATQYWGQDLKAVPSSPMLTNNAAYKVFDAGGGEYTNWTNTISNDADWVTFSKLVANGYTSLNATLTADIDAGSKMVGTDADGKRYAGTFDGAGHTLTFTYSGSDTEVGPFKCVQAATFKDLHVTGNITSSGQLIAGLIGKNKGATKITRCASSVNLITDHSDSRPGGFVGRSSDDGATITFSYCVYDGNITATKQACGFVGWAAGQTMYVSNCLVTSVNSGGDSNFIGGYGTKTISTSYYLNQFGTSTQGTQLNKQLLTSGQAAWELNQGIGDGAWFFGQGKLNTSMVDACPALTTDNTKKVVRTQAQYTGTKLYVNPGGAIPNAVRLKALGWYIGDTESDVLTSIPADFVGGDDAIKRTKNYFKLKVSSAGATTLMVPFTTTRLPENVKAYDLTFDGTEVTATKVDFITANKPVLINAPAGEYLFSAEETGMVMTLSDGWIEYGASSYTNGSLTGVYNEAGSSSASNPLSYVPTGAYVLQNGADDLGFYRVTDGDPIKITSFRAYLTAPVSARSLRIVYPDDETTGISATLNDNGKMRNDRVVYNLNGQRVEQATKGLYIKNGKKVVIK